MKSLLFGLAIFFSFSALALPPSQLLLIGGGAHPPELISRFVNQAGRSQAHLLVITWATELPDEAMKQMSAEFNTVPGVWVLEAERRPITSETKQKLLYEINGATGIFFTGGDQTKIMSVVVDPEIREALIKSYREGKVFGGTSAGTAIMSPVMFTGHNDDLAQGLGLLPGTLLDTHFIVRSRLERLASALHKVPRLIGLGVDQDNAVWVTGGSHVEVFGATHLTAIATKPDGTQVTRLFKAGQNFILPIHQ